MAASMPRRLESICPNYETGSINFLKPNTFRIQKADMKKLIEKVERYLKDVEKLLSA